MVHMREGLEVYIVAWQLEAGRVEAEETAVIRKRQINTFPRQRTRDSTSENSWQLCFLLGPRRGYISRS
jgi:hypothetical protein